MAGFRHFVTIYKMKDIIIAGTTLSKWQSLHKISAVQKLKIPLIKLHVVFTNKSK
jgi:hypothetical protein